MKFDIVIGNPPYQSFNNSGDGRNGGQSLYDAFVLLGYKLSQKGVVMIIPSRWFNGIKNAQFRNTITSPGHLKTLIDYPVSTDCFPSVQIAGGVCILDLDINYTGSTEIHTKTSTGTTSFLTDLRKLGIVIRNKEYSDILNKVRQYRLATETGSAEPLYLSDVSKKNPYNIPVNFIGPTIRTSSTDIKIYASNNQIFYIPSTSPELSNQDLAGYKVFTGELNPDAGGLNGNKPSNGINRPRIAEPNEIVTNTFMILGVYPTRTEAENMLTYISCKLPRFLLITTLSSLHLYNSLYNVPILPNRAWTDTELYAELRLTESEISIVENKMRAFH